jgi:hypothetical protein
MEDPRRKSIPTLKINIFFPTQFQESISPPITRPKIPAQVFTGSCLHLKQPPLAGSVTIYAKTTVDFSPDSFMEILTCLGTL